MRIAAPPILSLVLIATSALAQDLPYCGQPGTRWDEKCICQRYNDKDSTLEDFDCDTLTVLKNTPVPRERLNEQENTVEELDRETGKVTKSIPATGDFPTYGLSQEDRSKLDELCESTPYRQGDQHEWCLATRNAERVRTAHLKELMAIPRVSNVAISVPPDRDLSKVQVWLMLQVMCPKDLPGVKAMAPGQVDGVPIGVAPVKVAVFLQATSECHDDPKTGRKQCVEVDQKCDPYNDPVTCKPHCWTVRKPIDDPNDDAGHDGGVSTEETR